MENIVVGQQWTDAASLDGVGQVTIAAVSETHVLYRVNYTECSYTETRARFERMFAKVPADD